MKRKIRIIPGLSGPFATLFPVTTVVQADGAAGSEQASAHSLTVGAGFVDPVGFHDSSPAFSWKLPDGVERQTAYQIQITTGGETADTGWIESERSTLVPYNGPPLTSRQRVEWRVRFRNEKGIESAWSRPAGFELGLLSADDWKAQWIRPAKSADPGQEPVAWLRRHFVLGKEVANARLHVTARGIFQLRINESRVGRDHFANGWTSYHKRLDTLTYDVTGQLAAGENRLQAILGKGWYGGRLVWENRLGHYGNDPELLLQLEIEYADGSSEIIVSDDTWEATWEGPIISSSIYDGEHYDARKEISGWEPVAASADLGKARLIPKPFPPVRETEVLTVKKLTQPEPGRFVFDLGQNMVGWPRLSIPVEKDKTVTIRFAEMLQKDGTMYTANYRSAKSIDTYTPAETGTVEWEPHLTFHGFRYVELSGLPEGVEPGEDWVRGIVLHSDLSRTGRFESSHEMLNQLQSNIVWGQRGNFLDIPTDCPQRDERLGWTGDAQVFCATSMFNYNSHAFWKSWLSSVRDDQFPDGRIPNVVPDVLKEGTSPGWMEAATIIPWEVYVRTGDTDMLAANLEMMEKLVGFYRSLATDGLIEKIPAFGDWLQPHSSETTGDTPAHLLGTAFYGKSVRILAESARVLGCDDKRECYSAEADLVKKAFAAHYFDAEGRLKNAPETQTGYIVALEFDLIPHDLRPRAAKHLVRLVGEAGGHIRTGFLGTPYIVGVIDRMGYHDVAYDLLLKETYPSWFFSIHQGATTIWERWNSYSHADGFGDVAMNSFNHYAYGAIGQWMYERVAGLTPDPANPGYKHFFVRPLIGEALDFARAELDTPYGMASSGWTREGNKIIVDVVVPPNTAATIELPGGREPVRVAAGSHRFEASLR